MEIKEEIFQKPAMHLSLVMNMGTVPQGFMTERYIRTLPEVQHNVTQLQYPDRKGKIFSPYLYIKICLIELSQFIRELNAQLSSPSGSLPLPAPMKNVKFSAEDRLIGVIRYIKRTQFLLRR
jgi:hypothetical protein